MSRISSQETFMGLVWQKAYRKHCLLPLQMVVSYTCILFIQCCDLHNTYVLQWHMSFWYLLMVYSKNQWCTLHLGPIWSVKPSNFHSRSHRYSQNRYDPPKSFPARYKSKTVKSLRLRQYCSHIRRGQVTTSLWHNVQNQVVESDIKEGQPPWHSLLHLWWYSDTYSQKYPKVAETLRTAHSDKKGKSASE